MKALRRLFNAGEPPHTLVVPAAVPAKDVGEFIAFAKARPSELHYGSAGIGSPPHLSMGLFARGAGLKMVHVPDKGVGGALPDRLAGRVQVMAVALGSARALLQAGRRRPPGTGAQK